MDSQIKYDKCSGMQLTIPSTLLHAVLLLHVLTEDALGDVLPVWVQQTIVHLLWYGFQLWLSQEPSNRGNCLILISGGYHKLPGHINTSPPLPQAAWPYKYLSTPTPPRQRHCGPSTSAIVIFINSVCLNIFFNNNVAQLLKKWTTPSLRWRSPTTPSQTSPPEGHIIIKLALKVWRGTWEHMLPLMNTQLTERLEPL